MGELQIKRGERSQRSKRKQKRPGRSRVAMAEEAGFEPAVAVTPQLFSRQSHSAALAPFRLKTLSGMTAKDHRVSR